MLQVNQKDSALKTNLDNLHRSCLRIAGDIPNVAHTVHQSALHDNYPQFPPRSPPHNYTSVWTDTHAGTTPTRLKL